MSNKDYENTRPPEFHERMPWEPFKSNTPPEDPLWAAYDAARAAAAQNEKMNIEHKPEETPVCPFRKRTYYMAGNPNHSWNVHVEKADYLEEDFLPCLKDKCALYNYHYKQCGMSNRFN